MGGSQAKPEAILSPVRHTGSHREVVINVSYYDNHSKKIKQVKSGLRVNRKGIFHDHSGESQATTMGHRKYLHARKGFAD